MADNDIGITDNQEMMFVFPRDNGKWTAQPGSVAVHDGHLHKIEWPGFETRSGGDFGITATFHVVEGYPVLKWTGGRADVRKWVVQNGRIMSMDVVAEGTEIVG